MSFSTTSPNAVSSICMPHEINCRLFYYLTKRHFIFLYASRNYHVSFYASQFEKLSFLLASRNTSPLQAATMKNPRRTTTTTTTNEMKTTATAPVTAAGKAKGGNKKKASVPKANAKATTTTVNREKKKKNKNISTAANIDASTDTISTAAAAAAAAAGTDDYNSIPRVPRKTDRRIIDNDNDSQGVMNSNFNNNNNNNSNNSDNNISTAAAAAGTEEYKSMYHVRKDNDKQGINMRHVLEGGAGKKKENDDDDDDDDFNDDDFLGSLGLDFNISLYADEEGDIVNDSYYCDAGGKGRGRPRNEGCPHKEPDTTGMSDSKREEVMEAYSKAWTDKKLNARSKITTKNG
jgi:hypothetical protein